MEQTYYIEVRKSGKWNEHSKTPFTTMDEAARECLLIMPDIKRHFDGIRIIGVSNGDDNQPAQRAIVYEKQWSGTSVKPEYRQIGNSEDNNTTKYVIIGIVALIILSALVYSVLYGKNSSKVITQTPSSEQSKRNSYISHPPQQSEQIRNPSERATAAHSVDESVKLLQEHPSILDQTNDVVSIIDAIDHNNCFGRENAERHLVNTFLDYTSRTSFPALDRSKAKDTILLRLQQPSSSIKERDKVLIELGCANLLDIVDLYVLWFENHR